MSNRIELRETEFRGIELLKKISNFDHPQYNKVVCTIQYTNVIRLLNVPLHLVKYFKLRLKIHSGNYSRNQVSRV